VIGQNSILNARPLRLSREDQTMHFVMFYHSLVSDWNHGNAHFLRGVVRELLARGHRVDVYEPQHGWSLACLLHAEFYNRQRYTLNVTRADMIRAGYSPSVRLFVAAACGTPIISDSWPGLDEFFEPGKDLLVASNAEQTASNLQAVPEQQRQAIGRRARHRVLARGTPPHIVRQSWRVMWTKWFP